MVRSLYESMKHVQKRRKGRREREGLEKDDDGLCTVGKVARSMKQEARSEKQGARSKEQEARSKN